MHDGGPRRALRAPRAAALLALAPMLGLLSSSPRVVGSPNAELWGHLWVQGWHAAALPRWPSGPTGLLVPAQEWSAIDPLPTVLAALVRRAATPLGPGTAAALGHDLLVAAALLCAFWGGARLSARLGGSPLVGGLALAWAPPLMGAIGSGLTEDLGVGLLAFALAALVPPARPLRAGLLAGLLSASGLLVAWAGAVLLLVRGVPLLGARHRRATVLGAGVIALVFAALAAFPHRDRIGAEAAAPRPRSPIAVVAGAGAPGRPQGTDAPPPGAPPLWRLNPWRQADLLSLVAPGPAPTLPHDAMLRLHPGYLGLSLLALAAAAPRRLRWAWAPPLLLLGLAAAGPEPRLGGVPMGLPNPAHALLAAVPMSSLVHHHGRLLLAVSVGLAGLAGAGAARIGRRWPRCRAAVIILVALDLALCSPLPLPLPTATPPPIAISAALQGLPAGPLLVLPAAGPGVHAQRPLADQAVHGRPLILNPNQPSLPPGPWTALEHARAAHSRGEAVAPAPWPAGVAVVVALPGSVEALTALLGAPDRAAEGAAAWSCAGRGACPPVAQPTRSP